MSEFIAFCSGNNNVSGFNVMSVATRSVPSTVYSDTKSARTRRRNASVIFVRKYLRIHGT